VTANEAAPTGPSPTISGLRAIGQEATRTVVTLSDDREFTVMTEAVLKLGLHRDDPVDPQLMAQIEDEDLRCRIRGAALNLLSRRPRSRKELKDRLYRKEFPGRAIQEVLDRMEQIGLLDDRAFAESYIRDRVRLKPRGSRALRAELAQKGVRDEAEAAIETVFEAEEVDDHSIAREVATGWLRRQPPKILDALATDFRSEAHQKALRRYLGYMGRRGFGGGMARGALEAVREED